MTIDADKNTLEATSQVEKQETVDASDIEKYEEKKRREHMDMLRKNYAMQHRAKTAGDIAIAMYKGAANGGGASGAIVAGTAVVTAKVAAIGAVATAAAPVVLTAAAIGAVGYGVCKLFKWMDER